MLLLSVNAIPILRGAELRHKQFSVRRYVGDGMADIPKSHLHLNVSLHPDVGFAFIWSYFLKTKSPDGSSVPPRFDIQNFYPWSLGLFQLIFGNTSLYLHLIPHAVADFCVMDGGTSSGSSSQESENVEQYFPPWRLMMAALAGINGIGVGWWNLRRERHEVISTIVFIPAMCFWVYAVYGLLEWHAKF